ncbi:MAG TPA: ABC transporter ATP-binding protein [Bacteroidia bacterium]|nr:ABC transporter ATP-binding protein [Bacteroidia bacterium]
MSLVLNISNLSFRYAEQTKNCLQNLSLQVQAGERFGLFGPNGAGKTTLMHILTGLISFNNGSVKLLDNELKSKQKSFNNLFGFVPQDFSFYQELSPIENLQFFGAWYGLSKTEIKKRSEELLETFNLTEVSNKPVAKFSGGMKRRVNLAIGVLNNPAILFLDEPTVGVDIQTRHAIIDYLKQLNQNGTTLFYTSHQLHEAESLCTKIALIDEGKLIACDTLSALLTQHNAGNLEELFLTLTGKAYRDSHV